MSGVEVDPNAVVATGSSLPPLAADVRGPGTVVKGLTAPAETPLSAAFAGMTAAWGAALDLLARDMELLAGKVRTAGVQYRVTEQEIHSAFAEASRPVDFGPPEPTHLGGPR
jgi:hypothetical protein